MLNKYLSIDFEYRKANNPKRNLVSVAFTNGIYTESFWLENHAANRAVLKEFLLKKRADHTLLSFNVDAEAGSLIALGLNPIKFDWIDIQAEWKMLTNHNDLLGYGKQFIDGKFKTTTRKNYGEDTTGHDKAPVNLLGATFKLLKKGGVDDYTQKNEMRKLILNKTSWTESEKKEILDYGAGDVADLKDMYDKIIKHYNKLYTKKEREKLHQEMLWRGQTVARAAVIACTGYPVNRSKVVNFTKNIPAILKECAEDINEQFPEMEVFYWNKKENRYSVRQKPIKDWIKASPYKKKWKKTKSKDISLALEAWEKFFTYRHSFPKGEFPAQMLRWLKLNQCLNGFKPKASTAKNKQTFFSYYGEDNRAHPYLNAYGAQSSRYQPKATGFIHLKSAWMRSMVEPLPGKAITSIDYGSEEFFLSGLMSGDKAMIDAYKSGDVYLHFAKLAGAVPMEGERKDYEEIRDQFKSTTLGISYQMGAESLALKLTADTGKKHTKEDAQDLINKFYKAFHVYSDAIENNKWAYESNRKIILDDGWTMWGDNNNFRSVGNMPIQGMGACILRKAIQFCQDSGLTVILPLHDALYIEHDSKDGSVRDTFAMCMRWAFAHYFDDIEKMTAYEYIRLDCATWSPDYEDGYSVTAKGMKFKVQKTYVDERAEEEYKKFSKYFNPIPIVESNITSKQVEKETSNG